VARAAGISPESVRRAEHRATRERHDDEPEQDIKVSAQQALELPPSFETFGAEVPEARRAAILGDIDDFTEWHRQVAQMEEALRLWERNPAPVVPLERVEDIRRAASSLIAAIANAKPAALCAECLGGGCKRCSKTGVVGRFGNHKIPAAILNAANASKRSAREARQIQVEMPDGRLLTEDDLKETA
jgi:hypothetical protein